MSGGYRFFRLDNGEAGRIYVDAEGTCGASRCLGGFHSYGQEKGAGYAVRCPSSLTLEQRARLERPGGGAIRAEETTSLLREPGEER